MEPQELYGITLYLQNIYEERFPPLTEAMTLLWYDALKPLDEDLVMQAVRRWARQHTTLAPSLDQILEQVEFVREETQQSRRRAAPTKSIGDILREQMTQPVSLPELGDSDNALFRKYMFLLIDRSTNRWTDEQGIERDKLTLEGRANQCYDWAHLYETSKPGLAEELRYQARIYATILHRHLDVLP